MQNKLPSEIGGYFELELPDHGDFFPDPFIKFQSGRAALRAALELSKFEQILAPAYICDSVIQAIIDAGKKFQLYFLDEHLYPKNLPDLVSEDCALIYVNYFGLCEKNITRLLRHISHRQIIVDNTQALFEPPTNALATFYSPRKFAGLPDGGLLVTSGIKVEEPVQEDMRSINRMQHLLLRMAYSASEGYPYFVESDSSLTDSRPLKMSSLTRRILASLDIVAIKAKRRENFKVLANLLDTSNLQNWEIGTETVPLCYPLVLEGDTTSLKNNLAKEKIYIPTYWQDANERVEAHSVENALINCSLAIPCDQRYSPPQLTHVAELIIQHIKNAQAIQKS